MARRGGIVMSTAVKLRVALTSVPGTRRRNSEAVVRMRGALGTAHCD
jgi:hypothetical protein